MRMEVGLRERLERAMGAAVRDDVWGALAAELYVPVYNEEDFAALVREAKRRSTRRARSGSAMHESFDARLLVREQRRAAVVRHYFAKHASENELVRRFRQVVLDDVLLTEEQATAFLDSWANRTFRLERFHRERVKPARHEATLVDRSERSNERYRTTVGVDGRHWRYQHVRAEEPGGWNPMRPDGSWDLQVQTNAGTVLGVFRAFSVIGLLDHVARDLRAQGYPWAENSEAWFVLTGTDLHVAPLDAGMRLIAAEATHRATIRMEVEPWINHRTVADVYRRYQRYLLQGHNRPIEDRRLAVFRFVTDERGDDGKLPTWRSMMQKWNQARDNWQYEDPRNFQRDASEAQRLLLWPNYRYLTTTKEENDEQARKR